MGSFRSIDDMRFSPAPLSKQLPAEGGKFECCVPQRDAAAIRFRETPGQLFRSDFHGSSIAQR